MQALIIEHEKETTQEEPRDKNKFTGNQHGSITNHFTDFTLD